MLMFICKVTNRKSHHVPGKVKKRSRRATWEVCTIFFDFYCWLVGMVGTFFNRWLTTSKVGSYLKQIKKYLFSHCMLRQLWDNFRSREDWICAHRWEREWMYGLCNVHPQQAGRDVHCTLYNPIHLNRHSLYGKQYFPGITIIQLLNY